MRSALLALTLTSALLSTPSWAVSACEAQAAEKKLAGAAKASFLKKCEADAAAAAGGDACEAKAAEKKLAGAAKNSFVKKCQADTKAGAATAACEAKASMEKFKTDFKAKFNADVQIYAPYVYDAVNVMVAAMQKADSADPAKYLAELAKTDGYKGVTGSIGFDEKGDIKNGALTLYTYKGGKREQIAVVR